MKIKKLTSLGIALILTLSMAGCQSLPFFQSSTQASSIPAQSSSAAPSSEDAQSQPESSNPPASSTASSVMTPQTQQDIFGQTRSALSTKVPVILPSNVPIGDGESLTATTVSQTWYYKACFFGTKQPAAVNSEDASKGTPIATVEGTEYKNATLAGKEINYQQVDLSGHQIPPVDLGRNIKAEEDAGAGHGYLNWNEGRWYITMDSPNNPEYKNKTYPDSKQLAKQIVAYLDQYLLPAPQKVGMIAIDNWNNNMETIITWQQNQMVYQVTSSDPMTALKVAVAMRSE